MKVLDLFAGLGGWSAPFAERGHEVFTIDYDHRFDVSLHADVLEVTAADLPWQPDIILASPPCEAFSVMTIGRNWGPGRVPKTDKSRMGVELAKATVRLIEAVEPAYFIIENPRAMLRKMGHVMGHMERRTVTYCQYGEPFMKPTDLWGGFPPSLVTRPMCRPHQPCHVSAPRGSRTGIQGGNEARWTHPVLLAQSNNGFREDERARTQAWRELAGATDEATLAAIRAKVPEALALDVCLAAERDLAIGAMPMPLMLWTDH